MELCIEILFSRHHNLLSRVTSESGRTHRFIYIHRYKTERIVSKLSFKTKRIYALLPIRDVPKVTSLIGIYHYIPVRFLCAGTRLYEPHLHKNLTGMNSKIFGRIPSIFYN